MTQIGLFDLLTREWDAGETIAITHHDIEQIVLQQAQALLKQYDSRIVHFSTFMDCLEPLSEATTSANDVWIRYARPVVREDPGYHRGNEIFELVEESRSTAKTASRHISSRADAAVIPVLHFSCDTGGSRCETFASELVVKIETIAKGPRPYHARFALLTTAACRSIQPHGVPLAIMIGSFDNKPSLADYLRQELATKLLHAAAVSNADKPVRAAVRDMLRRWANSMDEVVRDMGIASLQVAEVGNGRNKWFQGL